jgi:hypothetical protein
MSRMQLVHVGVDHVAHALQARLNHKVEFRPHLLVHFVLIPLTYGSYRCETCYQRLIILALRQIREGLVPESGPCMRIVMLYHDVQASHVLLHCPMFLSHVQALKYVVSDDLPVSLFYHNRYAVNPLRLSVLPVSFHVHPKLHSRLY